MRDEQIKLISKKIGSALIGADYLVHLFNDSINALLACQLTFNCGIIVIRNGPDGETLIIEDAPPTECDLDEYGLVRLVSSDKYDPADAAPCLGRSLDRFRVLTDFGGVPQGLELSFDGPSIGLRNCGDELKSIKPLANLPLEGQAQLSGWYTG